MDNPTRLTFVPDRRYTAAAAIGTLLAVGAAVLAPDRPGRLLFALAALTLAAYAVSDLVYSPRLVISAAGVGIRAPLTRAHLSWDEVESVRADTRQRLGLTATTLEIDAGATLAVFSRRALGADPAAVAQLAAAMRPGSPGGGTHPDHEGDEDENTAESGQL